MKLNLWCWKKIKEGYINCDMLKLEWVDVVHNLDQYPYPFEEGVIEEIFADQVVEHLTDLIKFMEEVHRMLKLWWTIEIRVPYYTSPWSFSDPTHKQFFTYHTFNYFTEDFDYNFYTSVRFKIISRELTFPKWFGLLWYIFNKCPLFYQKFLPFIIPAWWISYILQKD